MMDDPRQPLVGMWFRATPIFDGAPCPGRSFSLCGFVARRSPVILSNNTSPARLSIWRFVDTPLMGFSGHL